MRQVYPQAAPCQGEILGVWRSHPRRKILVCRRAVEPVALFVPVETSPLHSLTRILAKKRRKVALSPVHNSYEGTKAASRGGCIRGMNSARAVRYQREVFVGIAACKS